MSLRHAVATPRLMLTLRHADYAAAITRQLFYALDVATERTSRYIMPRFSLMAPPPVLLIIAPLRYVSLRLRCLLRYADSRRRHDAERAMLMLTLLLYAVITLTLLH